MFNRKCFLKLTIIFAILSLFTLATAQEKNKKSEDEITALKSRVAELEKTVAELKKQATMTQSDSVSSAGGMPAPQADSELENELARQLEAEVSETAGSGQTTPGVQTPPSRQFGLFQNMNPNIGVIGNFLGHKVLDNGSFNDGFTFDESEISFRMVIDPFASADFFIAIVPPEDAVELEEAYLTYLALPLFLKAKLGFFRTNFGKFNQIHQPERPFIDAPLIFEHYFGEEGPVEPGVSLSWLVPNPWDNLIDLTLEVTNGQNEVSFDGGGSDDLLYSLHLKNFFDLTPNATLELGFSGVTGVNDPAGNQRSFIEGIDLTYRWKPVRYNRYRSFTLQSEFLFSQREQTSGKSVDSFGFFTFLQHQLTQRWFLSTRFDYAEYPDNGDQNQKAISGILTFWPSEFETLRLQYKHTSGDNVAIDNQILAQLFFVIGAHGAHSY